jgi:hypothetical protein
MIQKRKAPANRPRSALIADAEVLSGPATFLASSIFKLGWREQKFPGVCAHKEARMGECNDKPAALSPPPASAAASSPPGISRSPISRKVESRDEKFSHKAKSQELIVRQELAWNPNGCSAPFKSHFNDPVAQIDALQIH